MAVESHMNALGSKAPAFDLTTSNPWIDNIDKDTRSLSDYPDAKAFVIVFTCNHCPYAVHVEEALIETAKAYQSRGVQFIAICANDPVAYPDDSFEEMAKRAKAIQMPFPYLHDATQEIARAYGAACTPDIFVYDKDFSLKYRGRFDETRPKTGAVAHGGDLKAALDGVLDAGEAPAKQYPSIGCSIKWKAA